MREVSAIYEETGEDMINKYEVICSCGQYHGFPFDTRVGAQEAGNMHMMLGPEHQCTVRLYSKPETIPPSKENS